MVKSSANVTMVLWLTEMPAKAQIVCQAPWQLPSVQKRHVRRMLGFTMPGVWKNTSRKTLWLSQHVYLPYPAAICTKLLFSMTWHDTTYTYLLNSEAFTSSAQDRLCPWFRWNQLYEIKSVGWQIGIKAAMLCDTYKVVGPISGIKKWLYPRGRLTSGGWTFF